MSNAAFDTLGAARKLKASGLAAEQSETIVEVVSQSTSQFVTVERFDAGLAMLRGRIDSVEAVLSARIDAVETGLSARIDAVQTRLIARIDLVRAELRAEIWRSTLIAVGILIAANALMTTVLGIFLGIVLTNSAPP